MADSGLDMNSCFFKEDASAANVECSSYNNPVYDLTKRKVSLLHCQVARPPSFVSVYIFSCHRGHFERTLKVLAEIYLQGSYTEKHHKMSK